MITNQDEEGMLKILFKTTIVTIRLNSRLVEYIERLFFRARRGAGRGGGGKENAVSRSFGTTAFS